MPGVGSAQSVFKRRHPGLGAEWLPQCKLRLPGLQGALDRKGGRGDIGDIQAGARSGTGHDGHGATSHGHELPMKPELTLVPNDAPPVAVVPPPAQGEMPFAMVDGQPVTEMPRDLYIPPQALEVFLEAFEGPLDMLLYLIRRQNLDVLDIP